jgi:hypothetical protein
VPRRGSSATMASASTVYDPVTCGGFDGLESSGVNRNEGAESSMAFVGTMLDLRELTMVLEATPD